VPDGFKMASAYVTVDPDLEGFAEKVKAKAGDTTVRAKVDLDDGAFSAGLDKDTAKLRALGAETARPKVDSSSVQQGSHWMGLLVTAATMAAPAFVAAGVGVAAFGGLAIPTLGKVLKYEEDLHTNTVKAAKDWQGLDAGQRQMATSITGLKTEYDALGQAIRPQVVSDFNIAIGQAEKILPEFTGAAQGGGKALGGLLTQFGGFMQSGPARQFFSFVQQEAAPDMHALGNTLDGAMSGAMGLSQALNPLAKGLLDAAGGALTFVGDVSRADPLLVQLTVGGIGAGLAVEKLAAGWRAFSASTVGGALLQAPAAIQKLVTTSAAAAAVDQALAASTTEVTAATVGFAVAADGTTVAVDALTASETAAAVGMGVLEAVSPVAWAVAGAAAVGGLTYALTTHEGTIGPYIGMLREQDKATGFNIAGYRELSQQLSQTTVYQSQVSRAIRNTASDFEVGRYGQLAYSAATGTVTQSAILAGQHAANLDANLTRLQQAYGINRAQAIQLASGVKGAAAAFTQGGSAAQDMLTKVEGYAAGGAHAAAVTTQFDVDMATAANDAAGLTTRVQDLTSAYNLLVSPLVTVVQGTVTLGNDNTALAQALKKSGDQAGYHTQAQRNAAQAMAQSVQDTLSLSEATLQQTGSASKARGVLADEIAVLEKLGAKGAVAAELLRKLRAAEDALHSKSITISVLERGGIGGSVASGGGGGMLRAGLGAAAGGVAPGYAPGRDTFGPLWVSPGEGFLVPEAVRGLGGPRAIEAINRQFAGARISRAAGAGHFAGGGVAEFSASSLNMQDNFAITVNAAGSDIAPVAPLPKSGGGGSGRGGGGGSAASQARHQAVLAARQQRQAAARAKAMEQAGRTIAEAFADGSLKTITAIRNERNIALNTLEKYYSAKRIHPLVEAITRQTAQLSALTTKSAAIGTEIANMKSFAASETSSLASWSGLSAFSPITTGETTARLATTIQSQLAAKLATLKQFYALIGRLKTAKVSKALIEQVIQLGPDSGVAYAEAILSGGSSLIKELNSEESQIGSLETKTGQRAADIQFGQSITKSFLSSLKAQQSSIDKEMKRMGDVIARELARALGVPLSQIADLPHARGRHHHPGGRPGGKTAETINITITGKSAAEERAMLRRELAALL
jgi:hypothetical protein